jgi:hypothetical protein
LLLAAALFRFWDGRVLEVEQWIAHGDEYVVTLPDGKSLIVPQREVREIVSGSQESRPTRPASPSPPARKPSPPR